jgi:saccharopine dehydrogenase-like NADP-dependent oxidoreductase
MGRRHTVQPSRPARVLALGGADWYGQRAAQLLVAFDLVSEIVIAGRNLEAAERAAARLGAKARAAQVDVLDEGRLAALAAGSDLIVNTAGPEWVVVVPALREAIRAGVDYCDIGAHGPTTEAALALHEAAKTAGITAVLGVGVDPCLSNLMMVHATRQLDQTDELTYCIFQVTGLYGGDARTTLAEWREAGRAEAGWQMMMRLAAEQARHYRDGRWIDLDPVKSPASVSLPRGQRVTAYPVGMPEPITVPRTLREVRSVSVLVSFFPPQLNETFWELGGRVARGELNESEAAISFFDYVTAQHERSAAVPKGCESGWVTWVEAIGTKQGRPTSYKCWPVGGWDTTTGPLAAAALKILRGEIQMRGVLAPESCLDPLPFFAEVARLEGVEPPRGTLLGESFEDVT